MLLSDLLIVLYQLRLACWAKKDYFDLKRSIEILLQKIERD